MARITEKRPTLSRLPVGQRDDVMGRFTEMEVRRVDAMTERSITAT